MAYYAAMGYVKLLSLLLVLTVALTSAVVWSRPKQSPGCPKHPPKEMSGQPLSTTVSTSDHGTNPTPAPNPAGSPATLVPSGPDSAPVLAQLTQLLRRFSAEHRQVPKSLNELVTAGYLTALPPAPAGKQFAIEPKRLEVVLR